MSKTILITDGDQRAALASVRSLGAAGYSTHVCSSRPRSLAGQSRYCASETKVPDALLEPASFVTELRHLTTSLKADVLLPITEASLLAVLPARDRFNCLIPFVSAAEFERICDKAEVLRVARMRGIAVPSQNEILSPPAQSGDLGSLNFPIVIKPSRSVSGPESARVRNAVSYANNESELREILAMLPAASYPILLQQRIVGPGVGISLLMWNGELRAAFGHRRIREKPPSGGVSVLRESIPLDNDILNASLGLLKDLQWQGVAMIEYKRDAATGAYYLMEINARLWGSVQLAIDAGVDFPRLLVEAALGIDSPLVTNYRIGVRTEWEWGDVDNLLAMFFHSDTRLALSNGRPSRLITLWEFVRTVVGGAQKEVLRGDDPLPFFRESMNWIRRK